jgi:zinc/manganese transport system ATP-binding protein
VTPVSRQDGTPVVSLRDAALSYGDRTVWSGLDLDVRPGEFLAVLGPNGAGKTSFVRALLGRRPLSAGTLTVLGRPARDAARHIGYVPQQAALSAQALLRARDLVRFGIDGHRFGPRLRTGPVRRRVDEILESVGAAAYADVPLGMLSGGERQRVRIGQALAAAGQHAERDVGVGRRPDRLEDLVHPAANGNACASGRPWRPTRASCCATSRCCRST